MEAEPMAQSQAEKRRLEIYRAADAVDMALTGMRDGPPIRSAESDKAMARSSEAGIGSGFTSNLLYRKENGSASLFSG